MDRNYISFDFPRGIEYRKRRPLHHHARPEKTTEVASETKIVASSITPDKPPDAVNRVTV